MENRDVTAELKRIREEAGVGLREMARRLGLSPSSYGHYEDPKRFKAAYLHGEQARQFAAALAEFPEAASQILELAGVSTSTSIIAAPQDAEKMINVYDVRASAGYGELVDSEYVVDRLSFPPAFLSRLTKTHPKNLSIIGTKGESMQPTLSDDDLVMIDTTKRSLDFDGLFVLRFGDALHVKRIGRAGKETVTIISDNPAYPAQVWQTQDIEVVGKVIWLGKKV